MTFIKRNAPEPPTDPPLHQATLAHLLDSLSPDKAPLLRRQAIRDLGQYPEAVPILLERLHQEQDLALREAIFLSLIDIGSLAAVDGLSLCLHSDDAALRNEAIDALKNLPKTIAPVMARLLDDPKPDIRIFAINILESLRHEHVEQWLIDTITKDPHVNVCAAAVDLLGEVGSTASLEPLETLRKRFTNEPYIQFAAELALKRICEC